MIKFVSQSVEPIQGFDNIQDRLRFLEKVGRVCYKSEEKITFDSHKTFLKMILDKGHETILEHWQVSFLIVTSIGVARELARHRLCSIAMESTRYVNYNGNGEVVLPENIPLNEIEQSKFELQRSFDFYSQLIKSGAKPQLARDWLPLCTKTELVMTVNLRELRTILKLRLSTAAHPEMRKLANMILEHCKISIPILFDDFI